MKLNRNLLPATIFVTVLVLATSSFQASALPKFSQKENKTCNYCHSVKVGGGARGFRGMFYGAHKFSFKGFDEKKQSAKAGVKAGSLGPDTKPTKAYTGK